ncbi:MAG TPA: dATP/dGTP pyrophosphohydrolase domain-containing protein [Hyphomicrobiales bacterium]|nr:dATP/dGTP pyrophosphohydrolase domain-containing protein [Hyphomicrobiales bacterium]
METFDLIQHLRRQRTFSERTFGPGHRTAGIIDHIRKELLEVERAPLDLFEWIDLVLLALDGAWRAGYASEQIAAALETKQTRNEQRAWPDWRSMPEGQAIEHERIGPDTHDWSDAPADATHYHPRQRAYYKRVVEWYLWSRIEDGRQRPWLYSIDASDSEEWIVRPAQDAKGRAQCARCLQGTEPAMCGAFAIHPTTFNGFADPSDLCNWCGHTRACHLTCKACHGTGRLMLYGGHGTVAHVLPCSLCCKRRLAQQEGSHG